MIKMKKKSEIDRIIYVIRNLITKKKYVGQTYLEKYYKKNYWGGGTHIQDSIKLYGKENFTRDILMYCKDYKESDLAERYCVKHLNTKHPNGYNHNDGGDCNNPSDKTRKKISNIYNSKSDEEKEIWKQRISDAQSNRTDAERAIVRKNHRNGYKNIPDEEKKLSKQKEMNTKNAKSDDEKKKIIQKRKNTRNNWSDEKRLLHNQRISEKLKGKKKSLESIAKGIATKNAKSDEEKKLIKQKTQNTWQNKSDEEKKITSKRMSNAKLNKSDKEKTITSQRMKNAKKKWSEEKKIQIYIIHSDAMNNRSDKEKKLWKQKISNTKNNKSNNFKKLKSQKHRVTKTTNRIKKLKLLNDNLNQDLLTNLYNRLIEEKDILNKLL